MAVYQSQFTGPEIDERLAAVSDKVDKVEGKGLSENDFTNADKTKLGNIAAGAQVNVIETVKVNGTTLTPSSKTVNIKLKTINNTPIEGEGNIEVQGDAVKYTAQSLTTEQKAQARTNIGAASAADLADINGLIPAAASAQNQLADKAFVNSSVGTNTAYYVSDNGQPFASVAALEAYSGTLTNNDYAFVVGTDADGNTTYTRYKYNAETQQWAAEYVLNNSSFTAAQWAAISSGITALLVTKLNGIAEGAQVNVIEGVSVNGSAVSPVDKVVPLTIPDAVEANPTVPSGTTPTDLTGLKVGNSYYGIPQLPTVDNTPTANSNNLVKSGGVYSEIHPAVASAQPAGGMLPNVFYNLGTLSGNTTFAFASATDNTIENEWMFQFTTPSTAPTITWPQAITGWAGGSAPTINASKTYQVSVVNGLGVIVEF